MKKPILLFACISIYAIQTKAQSTLNLSEWATANKTELTYQNNIYQSGSYTLSDGSKISYLKKTGTSEQEQNKAANSNIAVEVYPNPSNGNFELRINNAELGIYYSKLIITNLLGQTVYQQTLNTKQETIDTKLTKGVYFLQLQSEQGVVSQKIVVQ